jgi:hypothetical protein
VVVLNFVGGIGGIDDQRPVEAKPGSEGLMPVGPRFLQSSLYTVL